MLRLVVSQKKRGDKNPKVEYIGYDGDEANKAAEAAAEPKGNAKVPELVQVFVLGLANKRISTEGPSKEELQNAKARDEREKKRKAAPKKGESSAAESQSGKAPDKARKGGSEQDLL